jgi:site-specific DNA-methyltransferase (adenine-specific)
MTFELNKIYNVDARVLLGAMEDGSVDLILTDFPYANGTEYGVYEDNEENLVRLIADVMPEILRVAKRALITCGVQNIRLFPKPDWTLLWYSSAGIGSSKWGFACWQPILAYGDDPFLTNGMGRRPDTIVSNEVAEKNGHPCPKPEKLWRSMLLRGSVSADDIICDPFMGSGTTAIVCEDTGRRWIGSEIDPNLYEIATKRIERWRAQGVLDFWTDTIKKQIVSNR